MSDKRIGDRYELLSVVGGGGMAVVYKARDLILDRIVAVKVLREEFSDDEEFIRRFRREAQSVASLSHPNIVNIFDIGDNRADTYYIVMEYVEGETLKDLIRREAPLALGQALHIMDQITSAIEQAHEQNIVHRDIKPQNILIDRSGKIKVTDFGIAVAMTSATITHTNSIMGSAHYFSPEQAKGSYANTKSDIYSLGIVLFEMLTGELPFSGTSPVSVALKHLQEEIPDPRELNPAIPQSVENIILKALSKDPIHRYETVSDMREDLQTALDPDRLKEPKFVIPDDGDQETKVMSPVGIGDNGNDGGNYNSGDSDGTGSGPDPDKHDDGKKKRRLPRILLTIFLILLLLIGATVAAFYIIPDLLHVETVKVPKVVGMDVDKAKDLLQKKNLKVKTEKVTNEDFAKGEVTRQSPSAKTPVKVGTAVRLFVSKGPKKIEIDSYIGKDKESAELLLEESDFNVVFKGRYTEDHPKGVIYDQEPDASTPVVPSKTRLVLFYSKGPEMTEVPDLGGMTVQEAKEALDAAGLKAGDVSKEYSNEVDEGMVISQSPGPETEVELGETVSFTVSKGTGPIPFTQPIKVQVDEPGKKPGTGPGKGKGNGNGKKKGRSVHVKIVYSDADHEQAVFKEEDITETKDYDLELTVAPEGSVTVWVYTDGVLKDKIHKDYEQIKKETSEER